MHHVKMRSQYIYIYIYIYTPATYTSSSRLHVCTYIHQLHIPARPGSMYVPIYASYIYQLVPAPCMYQLHVGAGGIACRLPSTRGVYVAWGARCWQTGQRPARRRSEQPPQSDRCRKLASSGNSSSETHEGAPSSRI